MWDSKGIVKRARHGLHIRAVWLQRHWRTGLAKSTTDDATFFTTSTTTPSELPEPTQPPAPTPDSPASTSSAGEETFLLSSTPLADEDQSKRRWPSTSASTEDDGDFGELEIIGKDELEAAKNDSDWSDVESESESDLEERQAQHRSTGKS